MCVIVLLYGFHFGFTIYWLHDLLVVYFTEVIYEVLRYCRLIMIRH